MTEQSTFTLSRIAETMQEIGYRGRVVLSPGNSYVQSAANGDTFIIMCFTGRNETITDREQRVDFIRFQGLWGHLVDEVESELDYLCNWFNATYPFAKVFRQNDENGSSLTIEAEVDLYDGMTTATLSAYINRFIYYFEIAHKNLNSCRRINVGEIGDRHNRAVKCIHGVEKDVDEAVLLYRENAHLGYAGSQNNFGDMFEKGVGLPKDTMFAMYWYARASERGEPTAYLSLAEMLSESKGTVDALVMAAMYATLAAEKLPEGINRKSAEMIRERLRGELEDDFFRVSERLAKQYRPLYSERMTLADIPGPVLTKTNPSSLLN